MTDPRDPTTNETSIYTAYLSDLGRIGERHQTLRQFYVSVITALLTFVGLSKANDALFNAAREVRIAAGIVGIAMCALWAFQMVSFRSIYSAKVAVLKKMEEKWLIRPFTTEEEHHPRLTTIDILAAIFMGILFLFLWAL
jgi:hypothetical protein